MRPLLYILPFVAVLGLAFWAYHENYDTQAQLKQLAKLQVEIGRLRDEIAMQKAEWAYLNRPARLRDLAAVNFDRLGLVPIQPNQLASPTVVDLPLPQTTEEPMEITGAAQTLSTDEEQIP